MDPTQAHVTTTTASPMAGQRAASVRHTTGVWLLSKVGAIAVAAYLGILIVSLAAVRHLVAGPIAMPAWGVATQPPRQWARPDTFYILRRRLQYRDAVLDGGMGGRALEKVSVRTATGTRWRRPSSGLSKPALAT